MIDRYHLRYFLAVIDHGNFSKAAVACNVSQPTLSVGIAKMEQALGRELFHRTNRRVELTDAGAQLASHARMIEAGFSRAERAVAGSKITETLRLGVLTTLPSAWIDRFLRDSRAANNAERIEIVEGRERDLHDRIARGRIEVALTIIRPDRERAAADTLFSEGYSLAMSADHPMAGRAAIHAEELVNEAIIVRRHCEALSDTSRHFTARGVRPFVAARTTIDERAMSYVRAGLGITVMPDCFTAPGIARPHLEGFAVTRDIGLIYAPHSEADELRARGTIQNLVRTIESAQSDSERAKSSRAPSAMGAPDLQK